MGRDNMQGNTERKYLRSHPWLKFDVSRELEQAPPRLWELLGGVVALAEHLAETPMMPGYARKMHEVYLAKGALATTAIEGNTLTEQDVELILTEELELPPSKEYLADEIR